MATAATKKTGLPGGGWLSMVPDSDDHPKPTVMPAPHSGFSTTVPLVAPPPLGGVSRSPTATPLPPPLWTSTQAGLSATAGLAASGGFSTTTKQNNNNNNNNNNTAAATVKPATVAPPTITTIHTGPPPRTKRTAMFQVGDPDTSKCTSPAGNAGASGSSYYGSSSAQSPAPFDVRASFAPMPKYGKTNLPVTSTTAAREAAALGANKERSAVDEGQAVVGEIEDDGCGITYAGRRWRGKTAHAVELEMEELGDRTIMSYAPDAVYLASRLEGLRRNLEASGGWRKPRYVDYDEETDESDRTAWEQEQLRASEKGDEEMIDGTSALRRSDSTSSLVAEGGRTPSPTGSPRLTAARRLTSHALSGSAVDDDDDESGSVGATSTVLAGTVGARPTSALSMVSTPSTIAHRRGPGVIDWEAKQAALDSRLDIRMLRRPDLEQVRELHCLHGDADKTMDFDTYTTSAGFLIRLLVDEKHVCLVAVAKPLPEPAPLPSVAALVPHPPPPSLDLPPSKSQYLLAGRGISAASPYLGGISGPAPARFNLGGGWGAPGSVGPPSTLSLSNKEGSSSATTPPDSLFSTSPSVNAGLGVEGAAAEGHQGKLSGAAQTLHKSATPSGSDQPTPPTSQGNNSPPEETPEVPVRSRRRYEPVLAGPTNSVGPPRAIRTMGAPPPGRLINPDAETILGVASATISTRVVPPTDGGGLWPGLDSIDEPAKPHHEAHILTLAVAHSERGQGLGARLLDSLLAECKRRACALASKNRRRGSDAGNVPFPSAEALASFPLHTTLEVHASNESALNLYYSRGFRRVQGARGVKHSFYQGDPRIPKGGQYGSDAWVLECKNS